MSCRAKALTWLVTRKIIKCQNIIKPAARQLIIHALLCGVLLATFFDKSK